jgi:type III secretory pathway component EscV
VEAKVMLIEITKIPGFEFAFALCAIVVIIIFLWRKKRIATEKSQEKRLGKKKETLDERHDTVIKEMQSRKEFCHNCDYCNEQFIDLYDYITQEKTCNKRP